MEDDDVWESVGWNASGNDNGYSLEKKERNVKGDRGDPAKDPPTVESVFSLGHKDRKIVDG